MPQRVTYPQYITLTEWAGKLSGDFSSDFMPTLVDEGQWQQWGAIVASCDTFRNAKVPNPYTINPNGAKNTFNSWEEWAKAVAVCMNNS